MRVSGKLLIDCVIGLGKRDTGDLGPPSPADGRGDFGGRPAPGDATPAPAPLLLSPLPAPGLGAAAPCCSWEAVLTVLRGFSSFVGGRLGLFGTGEGWTAQGVLLGAESNAKRLELVVKRTERTCTLAWLLR